MANIVGLNDGNLLSADNVYDSNQATDQQTINSGTLNILKHFIPCVSMGAGQTKLTIKLKASGSKAAMMLVGSSSNTSTLAVFMSDNTGTKNLGANSNVAGSFSNWTWTVSNLVAYGVYFVIATHEIESWSVS
jgi:hypothetical protein